MTHCCRPSTSIASPPCCVLSFRLFGFVFTHMRSAWRRANNPAAVHAALSTPAIPKFRVHARGYSTNGVSHTTRALRRRRSWLAPSLHVPHYTTPAQWRRRFQLQHSQRGKKRSNAEKLLISKFITFLDHSQPDLVHRPSNKWDKFRRSRGACGYSHYTAKHHQG